MWFRRPLAFQISAVSILPLPSHAILTDIANRLGSLKLLIVEPGRYDLHQRIMLNVGADDLTHALREDNKLKEILERNSLEESAME